MVRKEIRVKPWLIRDHDVYITVRPESPCAGWSKKENVEIWWRVQKSVIWSSVIGSPSGIIGRCINVMLILHFGKQDICARVVCHITYTGERDISPRNTPLITKRSRVQVITDCSTARREGNRTSPMQRPGGRWTISGSPCCYRWIPAQEHWNDRPLRSTWARLRGGSVDLWEQSPAERGSPADGERALDAKKTGIERTVVTPWYPFDDDVLNAT